MTAIVGRFACVILALMVLPCVATAQTTPAQSFDPFPGGLATHYQFDLSRNFFATPEDEASARVALATAARAMGAKRDSIGLAMRRDPAALLRALNASDSLNRKAGKHYAYLSLRGIIDTRDTASNTAMQQLGGVMGRELSFVGETAAAIPAAQLTQWMSASPQLARWRFYIDQVRSSANTRVSAAQLDAATRAANQRTTWQPAAFMAFLRTFDFGKVDTPEGRLDVRTEGAALMNHPVRLVREQWYRANRELPTFARDSFASLLNSTIVARNDVARMRGFADHREESYAERFLTSSDVRTLLERLASASEINKRYERARVEHLRRIASIDTVHTWDLVLPEPGMQTPRLTITEASRLITAALAPLGQDYAAELAALLDPANGRLDLIPRANRADRQGFSTGSVGYPSTFFQGRFAGYLDDVSVFAHEGGHSVQNMLMDRRRVASAYSGGPAYFTESFAGLNELLVAEYLLRGAADRAHQIYYLQRFLDSATEVFKSARESLFEHEMYGMITAARPGSAELFESHMQNVGQRFSIWFGPQRERPTEWVNAIHFYTRPLYRVNYVYAKLLALAYFDRLTRDPAFAARYVELLGNGYDAAPDDLLQRYIGMSVNDPRLVEQVVAVIAERVLLLERLYSEG